MMSKRSLTGMMAAALSRSPLRQFLLASLLSLLLVGCERTPESQKIVLTEVPNVLAPLEYPADTYLAQLDRAEGQDAIDWQLLAARAYVEAGQWQSSLAILEQLDKQQLNDQSTAVKLLVKAQAFDAAGQTRQALELLQFDRSWNLNNAVVIQYFQQRAELSLKLDDPLGAAEEYIRMDPLLEPEQQEQNHSQIWTLLNTKDAFMLRSYKSEPAPSVVSGWFELAALTQEYSDNEQQLISSLGKWQQEYPNHPSLQYLPTGLAAMMAAAPIAIEQLAVLLPMSGRYQKQGELLQAGIMKSYFDDENRPEIRFYDTAKNDAAQLYRQAINESADMVIGPLLKSDVAKVLQQSTKVPTLALNQLDDPTTSSDMFFFTLSQDEEGGAALRRMHEEGLEHIAVLLPDSKTGRNIKAKMKADWQDMDQETPLEFYYYASRKQIQGSVERLFDVGSSIKRNNQMTSIIGSSLQTEVRSRRDLDGLYLVASATDTRLIKPFIDVTQSQFAEPVKLYASSRSHSPGEKDVPELNDLNFSDMPILLIPNDPRAEEARLLYDDLSVNDLRLYAMGLDAYNLSTQLKQLQAVEGSSIPGATGTLFVNAAGNVQRNLMWATFVNGRPEVEDLPESAEDDGTTDPDSEKDPMVIEVDMSGDDGTESVL